MAVVKLSNIELHQEAAAGVARLGLDQAGDPWAKKWNFWMTLVGGRESNVVDAQSGT